MTDDSHAAADVNTEQAEGELNADGRTMIEFRRAVEARDMEAAIACLDYDVIFRSPVVFTPYRGRSTVAPILHALPQVFEDFAYTREYAAVTERAHALAFTAHIGDHELEGCDFIRLTESGQVAEVTVMIRPLSAALALAEAMRGRLRS